MGDERIKGDGEVGSIYKTKEGKRIVRDLYHEQVESLGIELESIYVETRFGRTHVLKTKGTSAEPIVLFHGGNSTAAYSLKQNLHLVRDYLVYAPDTIGHPGKSDERVLSSNTLEYGQWAADVIDSLGLERTICIGESFGGGILAKLMCLSPEKIKKAILIVPAGIYNASKAKLILSMGIPMLLYILTKKDIWFERVLSPMVTKNEPIDNATIEMVRTIFHHVKVNPNMPSAMKKEEIREYGAPTLLLVGEQDQLFPGKRVIKRAKELIPNLQAHLLSDCGHLYFTSHRRRQDMKRIINEFLTTST